MESRMSGWLFKAKHLCLIYRCTWLPSSSVISKIQDKFMKTRNKHSTSTSIQTFNYPLCIKRTSKISLAPKWTDMARTQNVLTTNFSTKTETIEKKLLHYMDMWKMEEAVSLLRETINEGNIPNTNVVLNLLQQLANLGETEYLLDLYEFLKEFNLVNDTRFFMCLKEAYYNSGRVDEGVLVLRILFHRKRKFRDVEPFFCLLAVMVIRHFPHRIDLIDGFVTDLKEFEKPVLDPLASLWKCYMLTEKFDKADEILSENKEIQPFIGQMVNDVCSKINKIDANYDKVLEELMIAPYVKAKLKVLVHESHAEVLCDSGQYADAVTSLMNAKNMNISLHQAKVKQIMAKLPLMEGSLSESVEHLLQWCDQLN